MTVVNSIWKWLCEPVNAVLTITYATAIAQSVATETGWRWARIMSNVLASLPGFNARGLATAAKKSELL
jgi:hypothetical protein